MISWFLPTRGTVTLGTTETEYIALSQVLLEVLFVRQMQNFVVPELKSRPNHEGRSRKRNTNNYEQYIELHIACDTLEAVKVLIHNVETNDQHTDGRTSPLNW